MKLSPLDPRRNLVYVQFPSFDQACNFIKKETLAQVFSCKFWENFKNIFFFYRTPPMAASVHSNSLFYVSISSLAFLLTLSKCHSVFFTVLQPWSYYTSVLSQAFNYILDFLVRKIPKATFLMTSK